MRAHSVPPASTQRLKQCRCVAIAGDSCLHHCDFGLLPSLLRLQHEEAIHVAQVELATVDAEAAPGGLFGDLCGPQSVGVGL